MKSRSFSGTLTVYSRKLPHRVQQDNVYITLLSRDTGNISSNILLQKLTRSLRSLVRFSSRILDSIFSSIPRQEGNIDTISSF